jgi:hypothetical protein
MIPVLDLESADDVVCEHFALDNLQDFHTQGLRTIECGSDDEHVAIYSVSTGLLHILTYFAQYQHIVQ